MNLAEITAPNPFITKWCADLPIIDEFSGFGKPAQFDVTAAVKAGANRIAIVCERNWLNELGTGGLMGPVVVAREK